jgi:flagellar basal body-associated protein FliL
MAAKILIILGIVIAVCTIALVAISVFTVDPQIQFAEYLSN